ncbi:MAG TPA: DUF2189 domain-containing protein [Caulobacteraceae bacterium]|jgi:uncharacterized membrane protein|nr:DUF2189 domain-containing protein [Caulobacteraceae bacterium]
MSDEHHIRNPFEYGLEQMATGVSDASQAIRAGLHPAAAQPAPAIRQISTGDLWDALVKGFGDLGAYRADLFFIGVVYPVAGLVLARLAYGHSLLPLVFPLASGFALIGPVAAVGLYEISRRRERGASPSWTDAFGVVRSPAFGSIVALGLLLVGIFLLWLGAAYAIFLATVGPQPPASVAAFGREVLGTSAGWAMIGVGTGVGFLFAVLALAISVVSFPLLLDRHVGVGAAIATSVRAVAANPGPMAVWGMVVVGGLLIGSLPVLAGLVVVVPLLGHATWHLYRKVVAPA